MTKATKSILIVSSEFPPQPGGIGNHAYNLAFQLHKQGYVVTVISDSRSDTGAVEATFDAALAFKVIRVAVTKLRLVMYVNRLWFLWQQARRHELIIASGKFSLWSVGLLHLFFKSRNLAAIHGTEVNLKTPLLRWLTSKSLQQFDKVIAVSKFTKGLVRHLQLKHIRVIPNGFDADAWHDLRSIQDTQLKGSPKLITVGRISERKGQLTVIRHLPDLLQIYPELHYHCVGIANDLEPCLKEAQRLGVENHVTFHGEVSHQKLQGLLKASDIFVMLTSESKTGDVEGFGIAILEANTLGLPAIGGLDSGVEDAILDGKSGVLIDSRDAVAFLNAIFNILNHREVFKKEALLWAKKHRWDVVVKEYVGEIEGCLFV